MQARCLLLLAVLVVRQTVMTALLYREWLRFIRQPVRILAVIAVPLMFWLVVGAGFGSSFAAADGARYDTFVLPGAGLLGVLFSAIFSTISVIEDRESGFLQGVLVAPHGRRAFVAAKLCSGVVFASGQAAVVWAFARVPAAHWPGLLLATAAVAGGLVGLGFLVARVKQSVAAYHSAMNSLFMPLWALSGALFPVDSAAPWLRWVMRVNPLTYGLQWMREAAAGRSVDPRAMLLTSGVALVLCALALLIADRDARPRVNA